MDKLKVAIDEPENRIKSLLNKKFNEKIDFSEDNFDVKIVYMKGKPKEIYENTIYLSYDAEYGNIDYAGKIFGNIDYNSIIDDLDKNDYYIREFVFYFRTKWLKEYSIAFAEVAITPKCNLRCVHCCIADIKEKKLVTFNSYKRFFNEFKEQGGIEITFTGGEPTMEFELLRKCIEYCTSINIYTGIITNGTLLNTTKLKQLKKAGMQYIFVSLYGKEHDKFTMVEGSFEKSLETVRIAKKIKFNTMITTVVTHKLLSDGSMDFLLNIVKKEKIRLYINNITPVGRYNMKKDEMLNSEELKRVSEYLKLPYVKKNEKYFYGYTGVCNQLIRRIYISTYGDLCPCPYIQISFGNIKNETLNQIKEKVIKSNYLKQPFKAGCLATQSGGFVETFLNPTINNSPLYYKEHPWFKKGENDDK